jgi:hypothetical protein
VSEFGAVTGDDAIMSEIFSRGPVSAYINAECIEEYTSGINMYDTCNTKTTNHAIQLNGWGTENGVDYWIGRNSWGTYWGKDPFIITAWLPIRAPLLLSIPASLPVTNCRPYAIFSLCLGEHGFFRIVRGGAYQPGTAYWAVPDVPAF